MVDPAYFIGLVALGAFCFVIYLATKQFKPNKSLEIKPPITKSAKAIIDTNIGRFQLNAIEPMNDEHSQFRIHMSNQQRSISPVINYDEIDIDNKFEALSGSQEVWAIKRELQKGTVKEKSLYEEVRRLREQNQKLTSEGLKYKERIDDHEEEAFERVKEIASIGQKAYIEKEDRK